jgi:hypothetical protein
MEINLQIHDADYSIYSLFAVLKTRVVDPDPDPDWIRI